MKVARWFGTPFNAWYVGKIVQINKRRTKQDNVSAEFNDETYGTTWGHWPAASETYGADRKWVLLNPTPIVLDADDDEVTPSPRRRLRLRRRCRRRALPRSRHSGGARAGRA